MSASLLQARVSLCEAHGLTVLPRPPAFLNSVPDKHGVVPDTLSDLTRLNIKQIVDVLDQISTGAPFPSGHQHEPLNAFVLAQAGVFTSWLLNGAAPSTSHLPLLSKQKGTRADGGPDFFSLG